MIFQEQSFSPDNGKLWKTCFVNPLSPNSDQHQISPCNINAYSTPEVMRIKDMITQGELS